MFKFHKYEFLTIYKRYRYIKKLTFLVLSHEKSKHISLDN